VIRIKRNSKCYTVTKRHYEHMCNQVAMRCTFGYLVVQAIVVARLKRTADSLSLQQTTYDLVQRYWSIFG